MAIIRVFLIRWHSPPEADSLLWLRDWSPLDHVGLLTTNSGSRRNDSAYSSIGLFYGNRLTKTAFQNEYGTAFALVAYGASAPGGVNQY